MSKRTPPTPPGTKARLLTAMAVLLNCSQADLTGLDDLPAAVLRKHLDLLRKVIDRLKKG